MKSIPESLRSAAVLAVIAAVGVSFLAGVNLLTRDRIQAQQKRVIQERLEQVLPMDAYDNDILGDRTLIEDPGFFLHAAPVQVFRARRGGQPAAVIMQVTAPDGYNGDIELLVGIYTDGTISGVRVIRHRETPGLGDPIERRRSDWIEQFRGRSLNNPTPERWTVKKDGGHFDQLTGATITPRAVVSAVERALEYHRQNRETLYQ